MINVKTGMNMRTTEKLESLKDFKLSNTELNEIKGGDLRWKFRHTHWYENNCGLSFSQDETWWGINGTLDTDSD
ncbi:MAG: hypothetical protein PHU66_05760 [Bacteroidaceae bacterium]|nr:hypothetical protein [Bacteroidaceae bacterium]